jgi:signal transduction histidine kinase
MPHQPFSSEDHPHFRFRRPSWWPEDEPFPPKGHLRAHRPNWWPENEPFPPKRRLRHNQFFRRLGCGFAGLNLFGLGMLVLAALLLARLLGWLHFPVNLLAWVLPAGIVVVVLIITAALSVLVVTVRRVFTPLDDLLAAADRVAEGDYSARMAEKGPRAVRSLSRTFNHMASRLQLTDQQRRDLLADVTHELRTPLTVVQGNLEGMLDGVYPADEARLKSVLEETQVLSRLVDDLRTLALSESGALQLRREPTDLAVLINESAAAFRSQADGKGVSLKVNLEGDLPLLDLDPERMRQVLSNLITNALRYTPAGGSIDVVARLTPDEKNRQAEIVVRDSGAGIPPEDLPHVFERYYKSRDSGGMGLGLAIARRLVELHGGTIQAESAPGQGTTMRVRLPAEAL